MQSNFDLTIGQLIGGQAAINSVVGIVIIARAIRAFLILLLSASALGKAMDMQGFAVIVASYQVLPESLLLIAARCQVRTFLASDIQARSSSVFGQFKGMNFRYL
jgi:hypothetical protein